MLPSVEKERERALFTATLIVFSARLLSTMSNLSNRLPVKETERREKSVLRVHFNTSAYTRLSEKNRAAPGGATVNSQSTKDKSVQDSLK
jgi:hypothetical protein